MIMVKQVSNYCERYLIALLLFASSLANASIAIAIAEALVGCGEFLLGDFVAGFCVLV
jgi:hypothetical protein